MSVVAPEDTFVRLVCLFINAKRMFVQATSMTKEMGRGAPQLAGVSVWLPTKLWHHLVGNQGSNILLSLASSSAVTSRGVGIFLPHWRRDVD